MERTYFMETERLGFSRWTRDDLDLARLLWGDPAVTRFICAAGVFSEEDILRRLDTEVANGARFHIQYWPVFLLGSRSLLAAAACGPTGNGGMRSASICARHSGGGGTPRRPQRR